MRIPAKKLMEGKGQGPVIVSMEPMSFLGGVGPTTGQVMDEKSPLAGRNISGHVLSIPGGKGSTVGSYILYGLAKRGRSPAAIIVEKPDTVIATGVVIGKVPTVYGVPPDIFRDGEWLEVDGDNGTVRLRDVDGHHVVTCFLHNKGKILLLRRSKDVSTFQEKWAGVSGYIARGDIVLERALREIAEETKIKDPHLVSSGELVFAREGHHLYIVHPFLFDVDDRKVKLDWEHTKAEWVTPAMIEKRSTVPKLVDAFRSAISGPKVRGADSSVIETE